MTREQAQELLANVNGKIEMKRLEAVNLLFREIDELKMMEEDAQQYALKCRKELEALQSRSCLSCSSCNKDMQLVSCPPQYTLSCEVFKTVFVNDFKQSCSRYCPKEQ